jgi:hypothetical protein
MANLVYCVDNNLLKNNYYFALSTTPACNPTHLPTAYTGIADFGASGFYFAPDVPVANLNLNAPPVGVQVANDCPEQSVASVTLASASCENMCNKYLYVMTQHLLILEGIYGF